MTKENVHHLLDQTFEDIGLLLGGLVATESIPDSVITQFVDGLAGVRRIARRRAAQMARPPGRHHHPQAIPHPSIAKFLAEIRADNRVSGVTKSDPTA